MTKHYVYSPHVTTAAATTATDWSNAAPLSTLTQYGPTLNAAEVERVFREHDSAMRALMHQVGMLSTRMRELENEVIWLSANPGKTHEDYLAFKQVTDTIKDALEPANASKQSYTAAPGSSV